MKLEEIFKEWDIDSKIDISQLQFESLKIPQLHNKYSKIYVRLKLKRNELQATFALLKQEKKEFYTLGPNAETMKKGWTLPPQGKILKADIESYLNQDKDIIALNMKLGVADEKLSLLSSILSTVHSRSFHIKHAIEFMKFEAGIGG